MFLPCFEITEAGEKIKSIVEAARAEQPAHVMYEKPEVPVLELPGEIYVSGSNIDAGDIVAMFRQDTGMPASSTGDVEHGRAERRVQEFQQFVDQRGGFLPITA